MKYRLGMALWWMMTTPLWAQEMPAADSAVAASASSTPAAEVAKPADRKAAAKPAATATDHLSLDTTTVTGNKELPKVMYIVPWKKAELGQLPGQPFNTLLNEVLQPVDREVFRREVNYYQVVSGKDQSGDGAARQATSPADGR